jgi:hypothetical protein
VLPSYIRGVSFVIGRLSFLGVEQAPTKLFLPVIDALVYRESMFKRMGASIPSAAVDINVRVPRTIAWSKDTPFAAELTLHEMSRMSREDGALRVDEATS